MLSSAPSEMAAWLEHSDPTDVHAKAFSSASAVIVILCYAIVLQGRTSAFRAGFWPDCYRESTGRPADGRSAIARPPQKQ